MHCFPDDKIIELFTARVNIGKMFAGVITKHIEGSTLHHQFVLDISPEKVISIRIFSDKFEIKALVHTRNWISATLTGKRFPQGNGIFYCNGTPIAQYSNGNVIFGSEDFSPIRTIKDSFSRRYLWARLHKQGIPASLAYATRRHYILKSSDFALASFCGDAGRTTFLTSEDLKIVAQLDIRQQTAILLMCYMWNGCAPASDAFTEKDNSSQGGKICSIPSFGTSVVRAKPPVHLIDYLVCFIGEGGWLVLVLLFLCYAVILEIFSLAETGSVRSALYTCTFFILMGITVAGILMKKPFKVFNMEDLVP